MQRAEFTVSVVEHDAVDIICNELATSSIGLHRLLDDNKHLPSYRIWRGWFDNSEEVRTKYARARELQAEFLADELIEIVDTEQDPAKSRVRMDARKWAAAKLAPKKYGEKVNAEVTGKDGGAINIVYSRDDEGLL